MSIKYTAGIPNRMEKETLDLLAILEEHAPVLSRERNNDATSSETDGTKSCSKTACVDALTKLGKMEMTKNVLGTTNAGKRLRAIVKQDFDPDVSRISRMIISRWKSMVLNESSQGGLSQSTDQTEGTQAKSIVNEASTRETGRAFLVQTGDTIRDKIRNNLFDALCICRNAEGVEVDGEPGKKEAGMAASIELTMFSSLDGVSAKYKAKFRQLYFNLKDPKNPDLRRRVILGEYSPADLMTASPEDLASDAKREENQRIRDKKLFDSAPSSAKKATTDQFQCGKCRQRKCTYYQMQTRSADEPMTTFVQCTNCNNAWKFC